MIIPEIPLSSSQPELTTAGFPFASPFVLSAPSAAERRSTRKTVGYVCSIPFSALQLKETSNRSSEPTQKPTGGGSDGSDPDEETDEPVD
jgi:hypothetical protein